MQIYGYKGARQKHYPVHGWAGWCEWCWGILALFVMFSSLYCLCLISIPCSGNSYAIAVVRIRWTILNTVTGWIHITHPLMKTNGKNWCKKMLHLITSHWVMESASNNDVKLFSHHNFSYSKSFHYSSLITDWAHAVDFYFGIRMLLHDYFILYVHPINAPTQRALVHIVGKEQGSV